MNMNDLPIIRAIEKVMGLHGGGSLGPYGGLYQSGGEGHVFLADYRCCLNKDEANSAFAYLWNIAGGALRSSADGVELLTSLKNVRSIVLVDVDQNGYDGCTAVSTKSVYADHLRAVDWVLAFYSALMHGSKDNEITPPPILILDVSQQGDESAYARFNVNDLPGLTVFKTSEGVEKLTAFAKRLGQDTGSKPVLRRSLDRLSRQWTASLTYAGDTGDVGDPIQRNHLLNNLLGPLALAVELDRSGAFGLSKDLVNSKYVRDKSLDIYGRLALMRAMELMSSPSNEGTQSSLEFDRLTVGDRELRILVLDDQIEDGWIPVLAHVLNVEVDPNFGFMTSDFAQIGSNAVANISLWVAANPDAVRESLNLSSNSRLHTRKGAYKSIGLPQHLRFTTAFSPGDEPTCDEILLLDLRLFGDNEQHAKALTPFEKDVQNALNRLNPDSSENWPDDEPQDAMRLTGLARLISKRDYTYPVVIWSSTGQRHIIEKLLAFRNIETGLRKPKFDSYGLGDRAFVDSLSRSLVAAQVFNETRHWVYQALERPSQKCGPLYGNLRKQVAGAQQTTIFLSIDESAKWDGTFFRHGGVIVVCSEKKVSLPSASGLSHGSWCRSHLEELEKVLAKTTVTLKTPDKKQKQGYLPEFEKSYFEKNGAFPAFENAQNHLCKVVEALEALAQTPHTTPNTPLLQVTCIPFVAMADAEVRLPKADALHLENIKTLILASVATAVSDSGNTALRVEIDGRIIPIDLNRNNEEEWREWFASQQVENALREHGLAVTGKPSDPSYLHPLNWKKGPYFIQGTPFLLMRTGSSVAIMSQSVTAPVVHAIASSVMRQVSARFPKLQLAGALTMSSSQRTPFSAVLNTMADYIPRFAISNNTGKLDARFLGKDLLFFADMSTAAPSLPKLMDLFFSSDTKGPALFASLFDVLRCNPTDLPANSFQSILLARIAELALPSLSSHSFWSFTGMWHSLQDRAGD